MITSNSIEAKMNFSPSEKNVRTLLEGNKIYSIPNFQRKFSWDIDNFYDFYCDLILSSGIEIRDNRIEFTDNGSKYFFGMILLLGDETSPSVDKPYEVIDVQQRLTTMTLFYSALIEHIRDTNPNYVVDFRDRLVCTSTSNGKQMESQRLVNSALNPILPVKILDLNQRGTQTINQGFPVDPETSEQSWLLKSYDYIKKLLTKDSLSSHLAKLFDPKSTDIDINDEIYIKCLEKLGNHLSNSTMICIYHSDRKGIHKLFRNLNYRGRILTPSDLIKNELFAMIEDGSEFASKTWSTISNNIDVSNYDLDQYIYHYMRGRYPDVTKRNLFEVFLNRVPSNDNSYSKFIKSLELSSFYYKTISRPQNNAKLFDAENYFSIDDNPIIFRNLIFLNHIYVVQPRILLLTLFECRDKKIINNKCFKNFIKLLTQHQAIHVIAKSSANKLTSLYSNMSKKLLELPSSSNPNILKDLLSEFETALKSKMPSLSVVESATLSYSGKPQKDMSKIELKEFALCRFVLATLSEKNQTSLSNRANDALGFIWNSSIEHIIDKRENSPQVTSLGNLLLLEKDRHHDVMDSTEKVSMYKDSRITFTSMFPDNYPGFSNDQINNRRENLLRQFYECVTK